MYSGFVIGYAYFIILTLLMTGWFIVQFDLKGYRVKKMGREAKVARVLGWFNIVLGLAGLIGNWFYQRWM